MIIYALQPTSIFIEDGNYKKDVESDNERVKK